jgi:hypothetical protein
MEDETCSERSIIYPVAMITSCFGLLVTIVVYVALPDLRNVPGKILLCLSLSLLTAYSLLATVQILTNKQNFPKCLCFAVGESRK